MSRDLTIYIFADPELDDPSEIDDFLEELIQEGPRDNPEEELESFIEAIHSEFPPPKEQETYEDPNWRSGPILIDGIVYMTPTREEYDNILQACFRHAKPRGFWVWEREFVNLHTPENFPKPPARTYKKAEREKIKKNYLEKLQARMLVAGFRHRSVKSQFGASDIYAYDIPNDFVVMISFELEVYSKEFDLDATVRYYPKRLEKLLYLKRDERKWIYPMVEGYEMGFAYRIKPKIRKSLTFNYGEELDAHVEKVVSLVDRYVLQELTEETCHLQIFEERLRDLHDNDFGVAAVFFIRGERQKALDFLDNVLETYKAQHEANPEEKDIIESISLTQSGRDRFARYAQLPNPWPQIEADFYAECFKDDEAREAYRHLVGDTPPQ